MNVLASIQNASTFLASSAAPLDEDGGQQLPPALAQDAQDVEEMLRRGPAFTLKDLPAYIDAVKNLNGPGIDDRKLLLEKLVTLMSRLPDGSAFSAKLEQVFIDILYKDLPHPPSGYLSLPRDTINVASAAVKPAKKAVTYAFRTADGANCNPLMPSLGKAGTPYARSVPSTHLAPPAFLPDPGLVFDTLLKRDEFVPHPSGISSFFFAFADLIIHSIFNTNPVDWTVNDASSYLDLSPLYGSSEKEVDSVRRKDGTGRLWNDVFADNRLLFMPPPVCALLVLFCRNHNYIAETILKINERGTYKDPAQLDDTARLAQDDELFQRARLVNTCFFVQVILGDYVGAILGLVRDGSYWRLNPLETMRDIGHEFSPQGEGNVVSIEFNLLYRWHATSSVPDEQFISNLFKKLFDGKDFNQITINDFKGAAYKYLVQGSTDVKVSTFDELKRDENGCFSDDDLANILLNATEASASAFKARGIPEALRVIEILGIEQARSWGTCSLNEFRKFIGLRPYANFKEWNPDPKIYTAAEALYHDIDNLELHVGLQAEEAKVPMPGAGLCPGYTISRAILADAVCLTRGDRFLTVDFTPFNLTSWGYQDCMFDRQDGSYGGMLTKLLFRTLPQHYPAGSAYAHFPFMVPSRMREAMARLPDNPVASYTWTRPAKTSLTKVQGPPAMAQVLGDKVKFEPLSDRRLANVLHGIVPDRASVQRVLFGESEILKWNETFGQLTRQLIERKSVDHVGSKAKYVDVVKEVINLVPVYWIADQIAGLPLKTTEHPRGEFRDHALFAMFADAANYVYVDSTSAQDFALRVRATQTAARVCQYIKGHLGKLTDGRLSVAGITDTIKQKIAGANDHCDSFLRSVLAATSGGSDEVAAGIFAEVVTTAALYSKALAHVVDYYLDDNRRDSFVKIISGKSGHAEADVFKCIQEALQSRPSLTGTYRVVKAPTSLHTVGELQPGHELFVDVAGADAQILGIGGLFHPVFFAKTAYQVLKVIFSLAAVQRASGQSGQLNQILEDVSGTLQSVYVDASGGLTPWPITMTVQYQA